MNYYFEKIKEIKGHQMHVSSILTRQEFLHDWCPEKNTDHQSLVLMLKCLEGDHCPLQYGNSRELSIYGLANTRGQI